MLAGILFLLWVLSTAIIFAGLGAYNTNDWDRYRADDAYRRHHMRSRNG